MFQSGLNIIITVKFSLWDIMKMVKKLEFGPFMMNKVKELQMKFIKMTQLLQKFTNKTTNHNLDFA